MIKKLNLGYVLRAEPECIGKIKYVSMNVCLAMYIRILNKKLFCRICC